jgi:DNA (cytosine-5)-methyltransferase 1
MTAQAPDATIDLFAGPGGWSQAARALRIRELGIEHDAAACETRAAAGHATIRADVAAFPLDRLAEKIAGLIGSPPCKLYSAAGTGIGRLVLDLLAAAIPRTLAGDDCRAEVRSQVFPVALGYRTAENDARSDAKRWTAERVAAAARSDAFEASLVLEPARYIAGIGAGLRWVALEQVPAVLPLWEVYAAELRKIGFSAWCGKLNSADYGVPQTRERAILIASRAHRVARPEPTHYDSRKGGQLWGTPWVSMAEALGWGATGRPSVAVTAGGTSTGGAEPFGHRGRDALEAERQAGRWTLSQGAQRRATVRDLQDPAPTIVFGHDMARMAWVLRRDRGAGRSEQYGERDDTPLTAPAPTISAGTHGSGPRMTWVREQAAGATNDSVRITVREAAILQSFPADYPWAGTKTRQFEQCGNAMPVLLALHVLSMATGIPLPLPVSEAAA